MVCPDQTAAFLNCKFVSTLTLLTGSVWGILSDKYGKKVLMHAFGHCNTWGLVLLVLGVRFQGTHQLLEGFCLYGAFLLMGLGSTVGGMLTVETGLLFRGNPKQQNRVISLLSALFDAGALSYLGLWAIETQITTTTTQSDDANDSSYSESETTTRPYYDNTCLIYIIVGYLCLAVICIGGYAYLFQTIQSVNNSRDEEPKATNSRGNDDDDDDDDATQKRQSTMTARMTIDRFSSDVILPSNGVADNDSGDPSLLTIAMPAKIIEEGEDTGFNAGGTASVSETNLFCNTSQQQEQEPPQQQHCYTPIAKRSPSDQLKSKAYVLMGIWFSFHTISNIWTLTTARDFLGNLGDDAYGNRYLGLFTLLAPVSIVALPFLDVAMNKYGFHAALQVVNALAIVHGIIKVCVDNLNVQIVGFVAFTFFRCFLYSVSLSCTASFIGSDAIGKATGTLYVLSGVASFVNIGLAKVATVKGDFFVPDLVFLVGTVPMICVTCEIGRALDADKKGHR